MKTSLLMMAAVLSTCMSVTAQTDKQTSPALITTQQAKILQADAEIIFSVKNLQPKVNNPNKVQAGLYKRMATSSNAFTVAQAYTRNCLTYNKNINAVMFTHRKSVEWAFTTPAGANSGTIQSTWTTNNGTSFDSTIVFVDGTNLGRYPGAAIYSPTGNTTASGAKTVVAGRTTGGTGWTGNYFTFGPLTTSTITTTNQFYLANYATNSTGGNSLGGHFANPANCMQEANGTIWNAASLYAGDINGTTGATQLLSGIEVIKASTSDNGVSFVWKSDSIKPAFMVRADGSNIVWGDPVLAFSPDGQTGYAVINGIEAGATGSRRAYQPIVYKTSNGGNTWSQVNAAYDWAAGQNPCLMATIPPVQTNPNLAKPWFSSDYGWDATVDNTNRLHLICVVNGCGSDHNDSLASRYAYDYKTRFPYIWDLVTTGNGTWSEYLVDSLITSELTTKQAENPWTSPAGSADPKLEYDNRIQVSRTSDGTRIFVGWSDSDTNLTGNIYNISPDIYFKAINAGNLNMAAKINITNGIGDCHFMMMSDIAMEPAPGQYQVPFTYTTNGNWNSETAVTHYYVNDAVVADAAISTPYTCHFIGISESKGAIESVAQNFPNPFDNNTTVKVSLKSAEDIQLSVYNTMGQMVAYKAVKGSAGVNNMTVDASNLISGIYFYTIRVNGNVITKKMTVQK